MGANTITKEDIVNTLGEFGMEVSEIEELKGERFTRFDVTSAEELKDSQLEDLDEDVAFNLLVEPSYLRIVAQTGTRRMTIEVPNEEQKGVSLIPLLDSEEFKASDYELPVVLGKAAGGKIVAFDLYKLPHLLIAGATGQGKSECLHTIVTSLVCSWKNVRLVLFDPKGTEFGRYGMLDESYFFASEGRDTPIIRGLDEGGLEDAKNTLAILNAEIDRRYDLLRAAGTRNIQQYNKLVDAEQRLPYIVSVIDEYGELVLELGEKAVYLLKHIGMLGRAVGIHSIIATQRLTYNVISGDIKTYYPARMVFKVIPSEDSMMILERTDGAANKLLGRGDMLFQPGYNNLIRLQCAHIAEDEFAYIVKSKGKPYQVQAADAERD